MNIYGKMAYIVLALTTAIICSNSVLAHRPHDDIRSVAVSPGFSEDGIAFIIVMDGMFLKRTTDHGNRWKLMSNGLDCAYKLSSVAVSPNFTKDRTVFITSTGDGVFKSLDGGDSWAPMNDGIENLKIHKIFISPRFAIDKTVLAINEYGHLYITRDGGIHWEPFYKAKRKIVSVAFLPSADSSFGISDVCFGDIGGSFFRIQKECLAEVAPAQNTGAITSIAVSPYFIEDKTIWVGTENKGVFRTSDGGENFEKLDSMLNRKRVTFLHATAQVKPKVVLFCSTWREAIFRSDDRGESWHKFDRGLTTDAQADRPEWLLPHFEGIAVNKNFCLLAGFDGLFLSKDEGKNWRQLETCPVSNITLLFLSPLINGDHQSGVLAYGGGAYFIRDVGLKNWSENSLSLTMAGKIGQRTDGAVSDVVFSPSYSGDKTFFVANEHELIKTVDDGENWTRVKIQRPLILKIRQKLNYYLREIGISYPLRAKLLGDFPLTPGWSTYAAISPDYKKDGTVFFGTQGIGQCMSSDHGKTCSVIFNTTNQPTTSIVVSPEFSKDKTLFIAIDNRPPFKGHQKKGVYLTEDSGKTFKKCDRGLDTLGKINLVISPEYHTDNTLLAGTAGGLFISKDRGRTWKRTGEKGLPEKAKILFLAISPDFGNDGTVVLGCKGKGIFKSTDNGRSFSAIGVHLIRDNEQLKQIIFSDRYSCDNTIYGISLENVFRSTDGGSSWESIQRPIRYEDVRDVIIRKGLWQTVNGAGYSDSSLIRSNVKGDSVTLHFLGTNIRWIGEKGPENGYAKVYIDGRLSKKISLKDESYSSSVDVFSVSGLLDGPHEITIEVDSDDTDQGWVALDALEIL